MRTLRRLLLAAALGAAGLATSAQAQEGDEPLLLDLCINERCAGVAAVITRGDDVLVDREALLAAGIDATDLPSERIGERTFVSLATLNHGSTFAIDRTQLRLDLKLRADLLPRQRGDLRERRQAEAAVQPWTTFANYAATVGQDDERALFLDGGVGRGHAAVRSTVAWDADNGWRRGLTRFELDQPQHLRRWTAGDQFAIARDPLGGGLLLGGIGVERAFDQDPYLVTFPQPFYSGVLETPGTVEVYANGVLIGRRELGAGPFTLDHLGIPPGRSDVRVVVRDPFGNRGELATRSFYGGSSRMLARGLSDYALRVGRPREGGGLGGGYDARTALQGWYRRGLGDAFTLGGRVEADASVRNLGVDAALRLPYGEVSLALAASDTDGVGGGRAAAASYGYGSRYWSWGLGARRADAGYRNLGDPFAAIAGRLRVDDYASLAFSPPGGVSLQFNVGRQRREGADTERNMGLSGSWRLRPRAQLLFSVQRRMKARSRDTAALLSLNIALDRDSLSLSARRRRDAAGDGVSGYGLDARRSRPPGIGWGYDLSLQREDVADSGFAQVEYQGPWGRYALQAERFEDTGHARMLASGAVVALGGRVFATPPLDTGFALVRVPGLAGVPILRENLEVGRTDARGDLLVRDLLPFHANRVALDEAAVPPGYTLRVPRRDVQVPRNTGALVALDAAPVHAVTGHFLRRDATGATAPAGDRAWLEHDGGRIAVPLGGQGRFYLDGLVPGRHVVEVDGAAGTARCRIDVPTAMAPGIVDLGEIECADASAEAVP